MADIIGLIKKNKDDIIKPTAVLLLICIIIPLALSLTNKLTSDRIEELSAKAANETMSRLIDAQDFRAKEYKEGDLDFTYHIALKAGKAVGYVFNTASKGYGGEISAMTVVNLDGTVKSVAILDAANETPGLGQNVTKEDFYSRFAGKHKDIALKKNSADADKNEIDAWTGATISSRAVTNAVNTALEYFDAVNGGDEK